MSEKIEAKPEAPESNPAVESAGMNYLALSDNGAGGFSNLYSSSEISNDSSSTSSLPDLQIDFAPERNMPDDGNGLTHGGFSSPERNLSDDGSGMTHGGFSSPDRDLSEESNGMIHGGPRSRYIEENPQGGGRDFPELRQNEASVSEANDKKSDRDTENKSSQIRHDQVVDKVDDGRPERVETNDGSNQLNLDKEVEKNGEQGDAQSEKLDKLEKAMDALPEGAVSDVFEEALAGLASGDLDVEAMQELTTPAAAQMIDLYRGDSNGDPEAAAALERVNEAQSVLAEEFGIDLDISTSGITLSEMGGSHDFNATVSIPRQGTPEAYEQLTAGINGPIVNDLEISDAMERLNARLIQ